MAAEQRGRFAGAGTAGVAGGGVGPPAAAEGAGGCCAGAGKRPPRCGRGSLAELPPPLPAWAGAGAGAGTATPLPLGARGENLEPFFFPAPPPLPPSAPLQTAGASSALAAALVAARAAAADSQARVRAAALALERERDAADALARQIAEAEQLLVLPTSYDTAATSSGSTGHRASHTTVIWHDPADPHVAQLHYQAGGVQNIRLLVPVVLEPESPSYARWRDLVLLTLRRYALNDHVLVDASVAVQTSSWLRLDSVVLSWIIGTISLDLHDLVRNSADARRAWLALEGQFLGNAEARALRLDASFRTFVQGDLSVGDFCRRMKSMADSLGDLGWPVEDRILVLNVLRGLSDRYAHLRTWITRQRPFPSFLQVRDDLVMEELTQGIQPGSTSTPGSSSSSTALAATPPARSLAPPPSSLLGSPPPGPGGGGGAVAAAVAVEGDVGAAEATTHQCSRPPEPLRPRPHGVHPGPPSTTRGRGASTCGPSRLQAESLAHQQPCSLDLLQGFTPRLRGLHFPAHLRGCHLPTSCPGLSSDTFTTLLHFFAWVSTQFGLTIKAVQCDNGREFDNGTSRAFFLSHGVQLRMSCPYTSSQNGKAERMIRTTNDTMRTLLLQASLPARFWAESLHTSTYLLNRLPSAACPAPTPHHALFGTPPRYCFPVPLAGPVPPLATHQ
ncbi:uncharacterized protein [Miscanthus floridulus]|uniref:uncharacterized protein n=1 Tax=Miscanthus floridulus TaxID=154761 RepID=UPI0034593CD3